MQFTSSTNKFNIIKPITYAIIASSITYFIVNKYNKYNKYNMNNTYLINEKLIHNIFREDKLDYRKHYRQQREEKDIIITNIASK